MIDRERGGQTYADHVAAELVKWIKNVGATTCAEVAYYNEGEIVPEVFLILNTSRNDRLPESETPAERDYRKLQAAQAVVRENFTRVGTLPIPQFRMISAPDLGDDNIKGITKGWKRISVNLPQ